MTDIEEDITDSDVEGEGSCGVCGCEASDGENELYFCQPCKCTFCSRCWEAQAAHSPKRNKSSRSRNAPHEKVPMDIYKLVQPAFSSSKDNSTLEERLANDEDTAWFGIIRDKDNERPISLQDYGRYGEIMTTRTTSSPFIRQTISRDAIPRMSSSRTPSLVSFVGQTGAGKSTIIKLLIQLKATLGVAATFPVVGVPGREVPTSEDVHLYMDPSTFLTECPLLYADCEGLDGGERDPLATEYRNKRESLVGPLDDEDHVPTEKQFSSSRILHWANSRTERTRHFAVSNFYPRLLFTFSDVVIFVHRNPRVIETVLERLIEWASAALETACNQPILPYAIIIFNASEIGIEPVLWDVDVATKSLFDSLSKTVNQNVTFGHYAKFWKDRGREIETVEQLMNCYYSSVRVVRLPSDTNPNLVHEQEQKLYLEIEMGCQAARARKSELRMLLNTEELQNYLDYAFDHYSKTLDVPFDFVQASFLHNPIPSNFGGNILKLAISTRNEEKRPDANVIFNKLGRFIASCIMLDAVRHNVLGTANHIFPQYLDHLDAALRDFCDRHWPCEYIMRGNIPAHLQSHLSTLEFGYNMRASALLYRCVNVRCGHESKGHQLKDGRIFARGGYEAKFSFANNRDEFHAGAYFRLEQLIGQLAEATDSGENQAGAAARIHRLNLHEFFHRPSSMDSKVGSISLHNSSVCWCCLFETPEHSLSCGHILCTFCVRAYGRARGATVVQIHECPFESYGRCQPRSIYIKPEAAGVRALVLDDGGVRSIIQLEILRLLDQELNGKIPIQFFFDIIVAQGSGAVIALGLLNCHWTLDDCSKRFLYIVERAFASSNRRKVSKIAASNCKYGAALLERSLRDTFPELQSLFGGSTLNGRVGTDTKLVIPASTSTGHTVIFSNYIRAASDKLISGHSEQGAKIWEVVRASMAHPQVFKQFKPDASCVMYGSKLAHINPITIADSEIRSLWPSSQEILPDIFLSLGTGVDSGSFLPVRTESPSNFGKRILRARSNRDIPKKISSFDQTCEKNWDNYLISIRKKSSVPGGFLRFNIDATELPSMDDVKSIEPLRAMAKNQIDPEEIRSLAARSIATLFYFDQTGKPQDTLEDGLSLPGQIRCRIPDGTPEICEIGRLLQNGKFMGVDFVVRQHSSKPQHIEIPPSVIDNMITHLCFQMPNISIKLRQTSSVVNILLQYAMGNEYPLSGFPRPLVKDATRFARHSRGPSSDIRRRPHWQPPDLPRFPSLDSAVATSDGARSEPLSTSSLNTPSGTSSPHELDAPDARNYPSVYEAMRMQRERERIRREEVAPLEQRLRQLESHFGLTSQIGEKDAHSEGRDDNL